MGRFLASSGGGGGGPTWGQVSEVYTRSRSAAVAAFSAAVGLHSGLLNLIKFDIVRDFMQKVGLFLGTITTEAFDGVKVVWGNLSNAIAFDLPSISTSIDPVVVYAILGILVILLLIGFIYLLCITAGKSPDTLRQGHEAVTWEKRAETSKRKTQFIKYGLMTAMSAYLPVSRSAFEILSCAPKMASGIAKATGADIKCELDEDGEISSCDCSSWEQYDTFQGAAVVVLVIFTLMLPIYTYRLIQKNKPRGSPEHPNKIFDEDGRLVKLTDERYQDLLRSDIDQQHCPYLFLYKGYERKWAFYKVLVMVGKLCLVLAVVLAIGKPLVQSLLSLLVVGVMAGTSWYSTPFLSPIEDIMDAAGRTTLLLTVLLGLIGSYAASTALAACVNVVNGINFVIMALLTLWGFKAVRSCIKSITGQLEYSDSVRDVQGPARRIIPHWDVQAEVKHRVWHTFWTSVLVEEGPEMAKRLREMQTAVQETGKQRVIEHYSHAREAGVQELREYCLNELEGVDVYWRGDNMPSSSDGSTCFGKGYIVSFPWHMRVVYDDCQDVAFIWKDQLERFVKVNRDDSEVARRRRVRQSLRALARAGAELTYHKERMETHRVPDGEEQYQDAEGNQKTRPKYAHVQVLMTYERARVAVGANDSLKMAAGFNATVRLIDGTGVAIAPTTGERHQIRGSVSLGLSEVGIDPRTYAPGEGLSKLLEHPDNAALVESFLPGLFEEHEQYRDELASKRETREQTLSSAFWLHVYDNDTATREEVTTYFHNYEVRDKVRDLPERHKDGLDYLFGRLEKINSHACAALWYVFWADVWESNSDEVGRIKKHATDLDPSSPTSICYRPMEREALVSWLQERGLYGSLRYIKKHVIAKLYSLLDRHEEEFDKIVAAEDKRRSQGGTAVALKDAKITTTKLSEAEEGEKASPRGADVDPDEDGPKESSAETVNPIFQAGGSDSGDDDGGPGPGEREALAGDLASGERRGHCMLPCAYRRRAPTRRVATDSLQGMTEGRVRNLASARTRHNEKVGRTSAYTPAKAPSSPSEE